VPPENAAGRQYDSEKTMIDELNWTEMDCTDLRCSSESNRTESFPRAWTEAAERPGQSRLATPATRSTSCPLCNRLQSFVAVFTARRHSNLCWHHLKTWFITVLIFCVQNAPNSPTSISNSKKFSGGDTIKKDLDLLDLTWDEALHLTKDRSE